jgi:branched-subunit amino acid aminotransferase/4-amino-4-deoxychorismate lyase
LYSADEVFLAGTASDIIPVKQVNIKKFRIGPLSLKLHKALTSAQRGRTRKYEKWLTYIK